MRWEKWENILFDGTWFNFFFRFSRPQFGAAIFHFLRRQFFIGPQLRMLIDKKREQNASATTVATPVDGIVMLVWRVKNVTKTANKFGGLGKANVASVLWGMKTKNCSLMRDGGKKWQKQTLKTDYPRIKMLDSFQFQFLNSRVLPFSTFAGSSEFFCTAKNLLFCGYQKLASRCVFAADLGGPTSFLPHSLFLRDFFRGSLTTRAALSRP